MLSFRPMMAGQSNDLSGGSCDWADLARKISGGDPAGVEHLYRILRDLLRGSFWRAAGTESFEDSLHETLVIVLEALQGGELRDPQKLLGFIRTVARRRMVAHIRSAVTMRRRFVASGGGEAAKSALDSPEARVSGIERAARLRGVLQQLSRRDREIIERFYFKEQLPDQICGEMHLTGTQFRLYKSRAIAKCSHYARPRAVNRPILSGLRIA